MDPQFDILSNTVEIIYTDPPQSLNSINELNSYIKFLKNAIL